MINILKSEEPKSLAEFRERPRGNPDLPAARYADLDKATKDELSESLLREQGHICCYCMGRIGRSGKYAMRIEHWHCQDFYRDEQLAYQNLLASCSGNEGSDDTHCDVQKKNSDLTYNPANREIDIEVKLRHLRNGALESDDVELAYDIEEVLNLNNERLKQNRRGTIAAVERALGRKEGTRTRDQVKRLINVWQSRNENDQFHPYAGTAIYWLKKKLR